MTTHGKISDASVYGVDLGKNVFHVAAASDSGAVLKTMTFRRDSLLAFCESD